MLMFRNLYKSTLALALTGSAGLLGTAHAATGLGSLDSGRISTPQTFIETYDDGTDTGQWVASFNVPRIIANRGGHPGKFLGQRNFGSSIPQFGTASPRFEPGFNDKYKIDSVFVGDWADAGVLDFSIDMNIFKAGSWSDRGVTLELVQVDDTGFNIVYDATYTVPLGPTPPKGWRTFTVPVNADSPTIPTGWVFKHGDGTPATDAEWSQFMQRIDSTSVGYYKPGVLYSGLGSWTIGIDNITLKMQPPSN